MTTNVQFNLTQIRKISYALNLSSGLYEIQQPTALQKKYFPEIARLEPPLEYPQCWKIIRGKRETWDQRIWTGLIAFNSYGKHINRWYYGDMLLQGKKTLLAFEFSLDYGTMNIYVFTPDYYPYQKDFRDTILFCTANLIEKRNEK